MLNEARFAFHDLAPGEESFRDAVLRGLGRDRKAIPCKFFYDVRGSALFEEICRLPEYYPTRTEIAILDENAGEIAAQMGPHCPADRVRQRRQPQGAHPAAGARRGRPPMCRSTSRASFCAPPPQASPLDFPLLPVIAVCADYTRPFSLPPLPGPRGKRVGFFPGSTIGNFEPEAAERFLANCAGILGPGGEMLIGVDLKKDPEILDAAYNDRTGVTAAFNLNLLERMNRELDGDLDLDRFEHFAFYSNAEGRVEIYIRSRADQQARRSHGHRFRFAEGELIHTEYSYKYAVPEFRALASRAGFRPVDTWTDPAELFSVHYLRLR